MFSLRGTLTAVFKKALNLLGMSSPTNEPEVRTAEVPVKVTFYHDILLKEYATAGPIRMKQFIVPEVRLCKKKLPPQHEYLSVHVQSRTQPQVSFYLAIERFRGDKREHYDTPALASEAVEASALTSDAADAPDLTSEAVDSPELPTPALTPPPIEAITSDQSPSSATPQENLFKRTVNAVGDLAAVSSSAVSTASLESSQLISNLFSANRIADDRVTHIKNRHNDSDEIYRILRFNKEKPLFLYELVALAAAIHDASPDYLLMTEQCYFYAGSILDVLQEIYKKDVLVMIRTTGSQEFDIKYEVDKRRTVFRGDGSYRWVPIYPGLKASKAKELKEMYVKWKGAFVKQVEQAEMQRQEAARKVDNLVKQVKQAEMQRQEFDNLVQERDKFLQERDKLARRVAELERSLAS